MFEKPIEYWFALAAGVGFVFMKNRTPSGIYGAAIAGISGLLSFSLAGDVSAWVGWPETIVLVLITAFGYLVLDTAVAVFEDRELVKSIIRKRLGDNDEG